MQPGSGPTVESLCAAGHLKWTGDGPGLLGASVAEMDFGTAPAVKSALVRAIHDGLLGYLPPSVGQDAARACADWQRTAYGWEVPAADVRLVPDVIRALHIAIEHFSRPGSPVIVPVPAYMAFLKVPALLDREIIAVPMGYRNGRPRLDPEHLERAFAAGGDLLLLTSPHNPLGHVPDGGELLEISRIVDAHGGRVFADEIHAPLVFAGRRHVPYASLSPVTAGHTLTATSASKAWNVAGLKCAEVILSNEADRERWDRLDRLATDGTSTLGAVATAAAFNEGRGWLDSVLDRLDRNRRKLTELVRDRLPGVRYVPPAATYLAWLDLRGLGRPLHDLAGFVARHGRVSVVDGADCGTPGFIRLNYATTEPILVRIVDQLAKSLGEWT